MTWRSGLPIRRNEQQSAYHLREAGTHLLVSKGLRPPRIGAVRFITTYVYIHAGSMVMTPTSLSLETARGTAVTGAPHSRETLCEGGDSFSLEDDGDDDDSWNLHWPSTAARSQSSQTLSPLAAHPRRRPVTRAYGPGQRSARRAPFRAECVSDGLQLQTPTCFSLRGSASASA